MNVMVRNYIICFFLLVGVLGSRANNVRVTNLTWPKTGIALNNILTMTCDLEWDNSWRDSYNYDAVYLFFKIKKKEEKDTKQSVEEWQHLYLLDDRCELREGDQVSGNFDFWLSPLSVAGQNKNMGLYVYRKKNGFGDNSLKVAVSWNITEQLRALTREDIENDRVLISVHAIEMVYVPRGAFRVGDGVSDSTFCRGYSPILPEYDLVNTSYTIEQNAGSSNPELAADRMNIISNPEQSAWKGSGDGAWWLIDFGVGNEKTLTYFGVNGSPCFLNNIPESFQLQAEQTPGSGNFISLWSGAGAGNWRIAADAYPIQKAIPIVYKDGQKRAYQRFKIVVDKMKTGVPVVTSISMTDRDVEDLNDYSVLIAGSTVREDTTYGLAAANHKEWKATLPATYPNGFKNFFAMKYEVTQEQYVSFLNKLTYRQQSFLLDNRLENLEEGDYIFGDKQEPSNRNGIILATKIEGMPAIFANNLNPADSIGKEDDGKEVACNYLCMNDMLVYADWAGLRPLTELEYEKMCRPCYPQKTVKQEYAWNTSVITPATGGISAPMTDAEKTAQGNANYKDANLQGPLRSGSFASAGSSREQAGASYWGIMELSGNLAELYYNVSEPAALTIQPASYSGGKHLTSHGDGCLGVEDVYNGSDAGKVWGELPGYMAIRGGAFSSEAKKLAVADRSNADNKLMDAAYRDSTVTFRLGRSLPEKEALISMLTLENGRCTEGKQVVADTIDAGQSPYYIIRGNDPVPEGNVRSFIWQIQVPGGEWTTLEGECDRDLIFSGFRQHSTIDQIYQFKRLVTTPEQDSEAASAFVVKVLFKASPEE